MNAEIETFDQTSAFKLSSYKGKVVVLVFWAYWCPPCRLVLDDLAKLQKEFASRSVEVIGISIRDAGDQIEEARIFVRNADFPFKLGWTNAEIGSLMADHELVPNIIVITGDHVLLKRFVGFKRAKTFAQLRQAVKHALKKTKASPEYRSHPKRFASPVRMTRPLSQVDRINQPGLITTPQPKRQILNKNDLLQTGGIRHMACPRALSGASPARER